MLSNLIVLFVATIALGICIGIYIGYYLLNK